MILTIILTALATSIPWALLCWRLRGQRNVATELCDYQTARATELAVQVELWRHRAELATAGLRSEARLVPKGSPLRENARAAVLTIGDLKDPRKPTAVERVVEQRYASPGPPVVSVGLSPTEIALVFGSNVESPPADNGSGFSGGGGESGGGGSSDVY